MRVGGRTEGVACLWLDKELPQRDRAKSASKGVAGEKAVNPVAEEKH